MASFLNDKMVETKDGKLFQPSTNASKRGQVPHVADVDLPKMNADAFLNLNLPAGTNAKTPNGNLFTLVAQNSLVPVFNRKTFVCQGTGQFVTAGSLPSGTKLYPPWPTLGWDTGVWVGDD